MTDKISRTKITSEDCVLPEMAGKYDLAFYVSQRARAIINGSPVLIEGFESQKNHGILIALEEIRQGKLKFNDLMESLVNPFEEPHQENEYTEKLYRKEDFNISEEGDEGDDDEDDEDDDVSRKSSAKAKYIRQDVEDEEFDDE
jgi:DNA-directed RNA polymerase subunit K/omega